MREVQPYRTERGLLKALDNGGRFFNIFTKAGDDQITRAELAKAAGTFGSAPKAALFFERKLSKSHRDANQFVTPKRLADEWSVSVPTVRRICERAGIPVYRLIITLNQARGHAHTVPRHPEVT